LQFCHETNKTEAEIHLNALNIGKNINLADTI